MTGRVASALTRAAAFLALWLMLAGVNPGDAPAAILAVVAATWASIRLLRPGAWSVSAIGVARLALRFPGQSVVAGVDVARRALDPALPLRPGFVRVPTRLPPGTARDAYCAMASLLPGTLPIGTDASGALVVHCLDTTQPIVAQLTTEEGLFRRALVWWPADG